MIVGRVLGTVEFGYYSVAFQLASAPIDKIVSLVTLVAFPSLSALQVDDEMLRRYYLKLVSMVALVTFPVFIGIFSIADSAVSTLLGNGWMPIVLPLKILCVVSCFRAIRAMNAPLILAKGKARILTMHTLLEASIMPIAFYIGTMNGIEGVALAWLFVWPVIALATTNRTLDLACINIPSYLAGLKHPVVGSVLMAVILSFVQRMTHISSQTHLALVCLLGTTVYLGYQLMFNRGTVSEALAVLRARRPRQALAPHECGSPLPPARSDCGNGV